LPTDQQVTRHEKTALAFLPLLILALAPPSHAQVQIDVARITCKQYLAFSVADPKDITIWLSGYLHGKQNSTILETQELKDTHDKLKELCYSNFDTPVMHFDTPVMQMIEKIVVAPDIKK
jgi:hypothetical protein